LFGQIFAEFLAEIHRVGPVPPGELFLSLECIVLIREFTFLSLEFLRGQIALLRGIRGDSVMNKTRRQSSNCPYGVNKKKRTF
jgi:hypothetical protein